MNTHEWDSIITNQEKFSLHDGTENKYSGAPIHAIRATAVKYAADVVIVDTSPYPGSLNRCIGMSSDYVISPAFGETLSAQSIKDFKDLMIEDWLPLMKQQLPHTENTNTPLPTKPPIYLGSIISSFTDMKHGDQQVENATLVAVTALAKLQPPLAIDPQVYSQKHLSPILGRIPQVTIFLSQIPVI